MIGFVKGTLAEKGAGYVIIEAGGIGYEIFVPANSGAYLSSEGDEVKVYTMMSVREDDVSLYGFSRRGELDAFKKLISVNGVGAKAGISILSAFTLEQLQEAIAFEDAKALTEEGRRLARQEKERVIIEETESYILSKAASQDPGFSVEVILSDGEDPIPESVVICGSLTEAEKQNLQKVLEEELAIAKENQIWIGGK